MVGLSFVCFTHMSECFSNFLLFLALGFSFRLAKLPSDFVGYDFHVGCDLSKPSVSVVFIALHEAA